MSKPPSEGAAQLFIGEFSVDPLTGEIRDPDGGVRLQRKVIDVLMVLASTPGKLVKRDEIIRCVWGDVPVADESLNRCITELRRALGDDPRAPSYIQTIPKRGYRLIAGVSRSRSSRTDAPVTQPDPAHLDPIEWLRSFVPNTPVGRIALAYIALAGLIVSTFEVLAEAGLLPDGAFAVVVVIAICGLPATLLAAWGLGFLRDDAGASLPRQAAEILVITLLVAALVTLLFQNLDDPHEVDNRIAVLPFEVIGPGETPDSLGRDLVRELIDFLTNVPELNVKHQRASFGEISGEESIQEVGRRVGARYIVEGTVRGSGEQLTIRATLIDTETSVNKWSDTYDLPAKDWHKVLGKLASDLIVAIGRLVPIAREDLGVDRVINSPGYKLYLEAREALLGTRSRERVDQAINVFRLAIERDSELALAHAGLCEAFMAKSRSTSEHAFLLDAQDACDRALALDPATVQVKIANAKLALRRGKLGTAERAFEDALAANPNLFEAHVGMGDVEAERKRFDEARERYANAIRLHTGDWYGYTKLGLFLLNRVHDYPGAIAALEKVAELTPSSPDAFLNLGAAYLFNGQFEEAEAAQEHALGMDLDASARSNLGLTYLYWGRTDDALEQMRMAAATIPDDVGTSRASSSCELEAPMIPSFSVVWGNRAFAEEAAGTGEIADDAYWIAACLAEEEIRDAEELDVPPEELSALHADAATYFAALRDEQKARGHIHNAARLAPDDPYVNYLAAVVAAVLGDPDNARAQLIVARSRGFSEALIAGDPRLVGL